MKTVKVLGATAAILVGSLGLASNAFAWDGCGWGYHLNGWGQCRPNYRPYAYSYAPSLYAPAPRVVVYRPWGFHHHHHYGYYGRPRLF